MGNKYKLHTYIIFVMAMVGIVKLRIVKVKQREVILCYVMVK